MTSKLEELREKPREKRTPIENCIADAALLEEVERDGEMDVMEQAAKDLDAIKEILFERATTAHNAYVALGDDGHRDPFATCPCLPCVMARTALKLV